MTNQKNQSKIQNLIQQAKKSNDWSELEKYCLSKEFQNLPYEEKNKHFITASKLKAFNKCQLTYKLKYVDGIPDPTSEKDYFTTGQAVDDLLTYGEEYFEENYEVVKRRGESDKTQLTQAMGREVENMKNEFMANSTFNHKPKKKVFFHQVGDMVLKAELDDYEDGIIRDIKSSASVLTFDPGMYSFQMSFYHWLVEENTLERPEVEIEVVDKYKHFSRSKKIIYSQEGLIAERANITRAIEALDQAMATGLFIRSESPKIIYESPYYGHPDYGRVEEPSYY